MPHGPCRCVCCRAGAGTCKRPCPHVCVLAGLLGCGDGPLVFWNLAIQPAVCSCCGCTPCALQSHPALPRSAFSPLWSCHTACVCHTGASHSLHSRVSEVWCTPLERLVECRRTCLSKMRSGHCLLPTSRPPSRCGPAAACSVGVEWSCVGSGWVEVWGMATDACGQVSPCATSLLRFLLAHRRFFGSPCRSRFSALLLLPGSLFLLHTLNSTPHSTPPPSGVRCHVCARFPGCHRTAHSTAGHLLRQSVCDVRG